MPRSFTVIFGRYKTWWHIFMDFGALFPSEIGHHVRLNFHNQKDVTNFRIIFITSISITVTKPE